MRRSEALRFRGAINYATDLMDDTQADEHSIIFLPWFTNTAYEVGDRRRYNDLLYKCIQAHTSQDNWTPDATPALWVRCSEEEYPEWIQPTGSQDAYKVGDKVSHNEKHWVSTVDDNVWEPGVFGWEEV